MWKFLCNSNTEKECLARQLFGHSKMVGEVQEGDTLFLHNRQSNRLMGPFTAATDGTMNIVEHAWAGRFPYQVYITWSDPVFEVAIDAVKDPMETENPVRLPLHYDFQAFSQENTDKIVDTLKNHELSKKIITKR